MTGTMVLYCLWTVVGMLAVFVVSICADKHY